MKYFQETTENIPAAFVPTNTNVSTPKAKLYIKEILSDWYIYTETSNEEIRDILIEVSRALKQMEDSGELSKSDLRILDAYNRGFNYKEIAMITKLTRQTVSSRIEDITKRLEIIMGEQ